MPILRVIGGPCDGQTLHLAEDYYGDYAQVQEVHKLDISGGVKHFNYKSMLYSDQHTYKITPLHTGGYKGPAKAFIKFLVPPDWTVEQLFERLASGYLTPDIKKTPWLG